MQTQKIVLFPTTHEQSLPTFHVERDLATAFLGFLGDKGLEAWQPPEVLEKPGPDERNVVEVAVEANTPNELLEGLIGEFLESPAGAEKPKNS